jgi:hypothetical protein
MSLLRDLVGLPVGVVRAVGALPGRLESMERSMREMQRLLAACVDQLATIDDHTQVMRNQLGRIDDSTAEIGAHTQGLGDNTDRLVAIASPLERVSGQSRRARRARARRDPPASPSA